MVGTMIVRCSSRRRVKKWSIPMGEMRMQGGDQKNNAHCVRPGLSLRTEEHFEGHEHLDSDVLAQVLQEQETLYQSFEINYGNQQLGASFSTNYHGNHDRDRNERKILPKGDSFDADNIELLLAIDESLAIALQEREIQAVQTSSIGGARSEISRTGSARNRGRDSTASTSIGNRERNSVASTSQALQSLGEAIGAHSQGLSDELISYLRSSKYKAGGLFSRKKKHEECVICCMEYKRGDSLITLPCQHFYHSDCATHWLRVKKIQFRLCSAHISSFGLGGYIIGLEEARMPALKKI